MTEPQTATAPCKAQQVTLKPGGQSPILSPNLSGVLGVCPRRTERKLIYFYWAAGGSIYFGFPLEDQILQAIRRNLSGAVEYGY
jgi:hypothetical protein